MAGTSLSVRGWENTLGELAEAQGSKREAQLKNLCQAHILLGCPVGRGGVGREEVNSFQPGAQHPQPMP